MITLNSLLSRASIFGICIFCLAVYLTATDSFSTLVLYARTTAEMAGQATFLEISISPVREVVPKDQQLELKVAVQNTAESQVTVLKWNTVFDTLAPSLGVFELRDLTASADVEQNIMMVRRQMPAKESDLVELGPKQSVETTVTFQNLELTSGHKYSARANGFWQTVWKMPKSDVVTGHLDLSGGMNGDFASNTVEFSQE
ncbi:hypothetical protein McanCB56680_006869 [Microsporum canis]